MKKKRLLVADDNDAFRQKLIEFLEEFEYLEVVGEAHTGMEAIKQAREAVPDMILMDVRMPEMDGLHATRLLKKELPEVKIIIISVCDLLDYQEEAIANGADSYVVKSSLYHELIPAINRCFSQDHTTYRGRT